MKPEQLDFILKARESISAARLLLDNGFSGYAVYLRFICHCERPREAIAASVCHIVFPRTGRVPAEFHRFLIDDQDLLS